MDTNKGIHQDNTLQNEHTLITKDLVQQNLSKSIQDAKRLLGRVLSNHDTTKTIENESSIKLPPLASFHNNSPAVEAPPLTTTYIDPQINEAQSIINSLIDALNNSLQLNQQLKFKNMILNTNQTGYESRYEVEGNLQKHENERIKTQMLQDKQKLIQQLNLSKNKVQKYKKRIVDKNREINKLLKLLNENSIDVTQIELSAIEPSSTSSIRVKSPEDLSKSRKSDMLRALGALATQVLNDDTEDASINQTYIQNSGNVEDENVTEAEISLYPVLNNNNEEHPSSNVLLHKFSNGPILPEIKSHSQSATVALPKMRSFNIVDGSNRDL